MSAAIVWMRRDLRLHDHVALFEAASAADGVCVAFVLDPELLRSERMGAPIVQAFFDALAGLRAALRKRGSDLALLEGDAAVELRELARRTGCDRVYFNEDYEPHALSRDAAVTAALERAGIAPRPCLDHVYFGAGEVRTPGGAPYKVFTPYRNRWHELRRIGPRLPVPSARAIERRLLPAEAIGATLDVPPPEKYGYARSAAYPHVDETHARAQLRAFLERRIGAYKDDRNVPSVDGTSRLSPHLRAGTLGIRECVESAFSAAADRPDIASGALTWIDELVWRDFYQTILREFPFVATQSFSPQARGIRWRDDDAGFAAWCEGRTGYPIVDAAMRQLNTTGWMHNRLRMIVASFLTKDLLIDWRRGERYFERHLADADLAQNNGGWQWAASTGTDAVPYFRVFNPTRQGKAVDPDGTFVRSMLPELAGIPDRFVHEPWKVPLHGYPPPIVDHEAARARAIAAFRS